MKYFTVSFNSELLLHNAETWYPPQDIKEGFKYDIFLRYKGWSHIFLVHSGIWPYLLHPQAKILFLSLIA